MNKVIKCHISNKRPHTNAENILFTHWQPHARLYSTLGRLPDRITNGLQMLFPAWPHNFHGYWSCNNFYGHSRLSADSRNGVLAKVCDHLEPAQEKCTDWLCWGLTTRQLLWVILCCLPEKGRKEIEEIVEEMKKRNTEERGTEIKVKKQKK